MALGANIDAYILLGRRGFNDLAASALDRRRLIIWMVPSFILVPLSITNTGIALEFYHTCAQKATPIFIFFAFRRFLVFHFCTITK